MSCSGPKISVIVVDYQGQRYWEDLLKSLEAQCERNFELIIVDNGGNLNISKLCQLTNCRRLEQSENLGFAAGCNAGAAIAQGDWLVFLNNDTFVCEQWLYRLAERGRRAEKIGAVVSKTLFAPRYAPLHIVSPTFVPQDRGDSHDTRQLGLRIRFESHWWESTPPLKIQGFHGSEFLEGAEWRWSSGDSRIWIPILGKQMRHLRLTVKSPLELKGRSAFVRVGVCQKEIKIDGEQRIFEFPLGDSDLFDVINSAGSELRGDGTCLERGIYEIDRDQFEGGEVTAFSACSVMIRREAFERLRGFDSRFFAYYEDTDLSWRMRKDGWNIVYEPTSVVRHHHSGTSRQQSPFFCFHVYRNFRWNVAKNARWSVALKLLVKECLTWIPKEVLTNAEFSRGRLKRETISGMLLYLGKRFLGNKG